MINWDEIEEKALLEVQKTSFIHEKAALLNTRKVLKAFRNHQVADYYLKPSTATPILIREGMNWMESMRNSSARKQPL